MKSWHKASISAVAQTLFKIHDFDPDRSVAIAFWIKKNKMIDHNYWRYVQHMQKAKLLTDLTEEDALELLTNYNNFKRGIK